MTWTIGYYSEGVRLEIEALPVGIRASYARLADMLEEFGLDVRMPYSRAMGGGQELDLARRRQREVSGQ